MARTLALVLCCAPLAACSGASSVDLFGPLGASAGPDASAPNTDPVQTNGVDSGSPASTTPDAGGGGTSSTGVDASTPPTSKDDAGPPDAGTPVDAAVPVDAAPPPFVGTLQTVQMTFYGWDDNTPPGAGIAYPKSGGYPTVHDAAGGTGTYADPVTLASDVAELPVGTLVYAPDLEKYLVMEDDCGACDTDWTSGKKWHVNVWMNSDGTENASALASCEGSWSRTVTTIEIGPPPGRLVSTNALFDPSTNTCRTTP